MAASEHFVDQLGVKAVNAAQIEKTLLQKVASSCYSSRPLDLSSSVFATLSKQLL